MKNSGENVGIKLKNSEVISKCNLAEILSYSKQIGLLTALQLRKNRIKIGVEIQTDIESIKKIGQAANSDEAAKLSDEVEKAIDDFLQKDFEGNFYMVNVNDIGNIKGEEIRLSNGGVVDAKWIAEQLIGSVIIIPNE